MTTACRIYVKIGTMKLSRLFEIVYLLLDRKKMTTRELAEYFEVSTRTILRDIEALSIAGVPVITDKGRNGGIYIMDSFRLDKTTLSKEEQELIIFALQNITASGNIETKGTLSRLSALFNEPSPSWIDVDFSRWETLSDPHISLSTSCERFFFTVFFAIFLLIPSLLPNHRTK